MNDKHDHSLQQPDRLSLKRWSRRKLEAARAQPAPPREVSSAPVTAAPKPQPASPPAEGAAPHAVAALPPIESLTIDSEFAAFFKPEIPEATKRAALKQLFRDPRFNIMDGLDVYIGDYSQSDPIPPEMMKRLLHTRHIFDPPKTEVNAEGHVVDVVDPVDPVDPVETEESADAIAASGAIGEAAAETLPRELGDAPEADAVRQNERPGADQA